MNGEEFIDLWDNRELRQWIVDTAKSYTREIKQQIHLVYIGWLAISLQPAAMETRYYFNIACRRMNRHYELYLMKKPKTRPGNDAGKQRVRSKIKKFL